ncbi:MAG: BrxE family protein [Byssovorax sp.]
MGAATAARTLATRRDPVSVPARVGLPTRMEPADDDGSLRQTGARMGMSSPGIDLDRLFKLRVIVARFGEMDLARWWSTKGQLGRLGAATLRRGFPRTYRFAQARAVLAVAAQRCIEVFDPPACVTLFQLPEETEQEIETRWEQWLDDPGAWATFFEKIESLTGADLVAALRGFDVVTEHDAAAFTKLRRSAEGRAVPLPGVYGGTDADVALLALGFARGEPGELAVPYMRRADA